MIGGFLLSAYSVVGNDVIQTLGTFLSSNQKRPWYVLWLFAGSIMTAVLVYGWATHGGDVSYGRLEKIQQPEVYHWSFLLPPLVLLVLTRTGIPVSTTFMILSFFSSGKTLEGMIFKSVLGYGVSFGAAALAYAILARSLEKRFFENPLEDAQRPYWLAAQWLATGFLWSQWLIQDLANIFVYLPGSLGPESLAASLVALLALLGLIFYAQGGRIQQIVKSKTNTIDIRSATFIDILFGIILYLFKEQSKLPMSTSWVFVGLLAGRELSLRRGLAGRIEPAVYKMLGLDLAKVLLGLAVSVALVFGIRWLLPQA